MRCSGKNEAEHEWLTEACARTGLAAALAAGATAARRRLAASVGAVAAVAEAASALAGCGGRYARAYPHRVGCSDAHGCRR